MRPPLSLSATVSPETSCFTERAVFNHRLGRRTSHKMDASLKSLILRARAEHDCCSGATSEEIVAAENRIGYRFTDDLQELLRACNGIHFWKAGNYPCRLLPTSEIRPVH